jgi:hypothetical protein
MHIKQIPEIVRTVERMDAELCGADSPRQDPEPSIQCCGLRGRSLRWSQVDTVADVERVTEVAQAFVRPVEPWDPFRPPGMAPCRPERLVDTRDELEGVLQVLVGEGNDQDEPIEVEGEAARDSLVVLRNDVVISVRFAKLTENALAVEVQRCLLRDVAHPEVGPAAAFGQHCRTSPGKPSPMQRSRPGLRWLLDAAATNLAPSVTGVYRVREGSLLSVNT